MKQLLSILMLFICSNTIAQVELEYYTNYGYYKDFEENRLDNLDGQQFYWYFKVDIETNITNTDLPDNVSEYSAKGFFYRKNYQNGIGVKTEIKRVRAIKYKDDSVSTLFYYNNDKDSPYIMLRNENEGIQITACIKSQSIGGKDVCRKVYAHSTTRFKDLYYESSLPSQIIN